MFDSDDGMFNVPCGFSVLDSGALVSIFWYAGQPMWLTVVRPTGEIECCNLAEYRE